MCRKVTHKNLIDSGTILNFINSKEQDKHKSFACFLYSSLDSRYVLHYTVLV